MVMRTDKSGDGAALPVWAPLLGLCLLGGVTFAAVAGWAIYGEDILLQALSDGWALCF
ncbi:hypothetical protein [Fulvimarina endophytica]|nr:hypothetical protein [Fulvimarina endophytica]